MTSEVEGLDLDALEKVAREARSSPWTLLPAAFSPRIHVMPVDATADEVAVATVNERRNAKFIATFDPPTVLRLLAALRAQAERVRVLEGENEQLRLAICGGEDAPGYAASLPLETILSVAKDNQQTARRDAQLAWDGETATTWKARAEAAERRAGELEGALRKIAFPPKVSSGPSLAGCIEIARALLPATQAEGE